MNLLATPRARVPDSVHVHREHSMAQLRARGGWAVHSIEERRRRWVARAVRRLAPECVVDLGCEDGWMAQAYVEHVGTVWLADRDPELLARSPLVAHPRVKTVVVDAEQPEPLRRALQGRAVDLLVLSALLEHLPQPRRALQGLLPMLAPGGRVLLYLPADRPILALKGILRVSRLGRLVRGLSLEPAPGHLHTFDRGAVARLLTGLGSVEEIAFDPLCLGYRAQLRVGLPEADAPWRA